MTFQETLIQILNRFSETDPIFLWLFFAFSNFAENVFPPWPGDTITVFGGFLVARNLNSFGWPALVTSTFAGNLFGAWIMYRFGQMFLHWVRKKNFPFKDSLYDEESIEKTFAWFRRNSILVVLFSRFSAGIRFFVSIVAGMVKMNPILFFGVFSIAVSLWCGILIFSGFYLGSHWEDVLGFLEIYNRIIVTILAIAALVFFWHKKRQRTAKQNS
ncbi:DedA family protein [Leptospira yasudae]|uniref:DedA family protein n=1 Tax=Leptospira yasudae TaxID=2202201 RepID=A0ABX9M234_9LEPT|nr:DedA family protein [Leptospira yasudae]MBW0434878.1 DedA family protein [Leptospira yasudae]RHX79270.1 DedA family protein [Leptospira yasudae]RHX93600.1 DedA family protein [Leptospira yasudae]TGK23534.1 DedA family protein [Leptospira yasudae]TGM09151.1 DedA family protein [Leptospira yasudae]